MTVTTAKAFGLVAVCAVSLHAGRVTTLDGKHFDGAVTLQSNGVAVTVPGGAEQRIPLRDIRRVIFGEVSEASERGAGADPVVISTQTNVPLNQSASDTLNGREGRIKGRREGSRKTRPGLTDAMNSHSPSEDNGWFAGAMVWDLGEGMRAAERQLNSVSVWIKHEDDSRCDYAGSLAVSSDGEDFTDIPGTGVAIHFGAAKNRGKGFNQVLYQFSPGMVTDFRYLRWQAEPPRWTGAETRFVEVDAFASKVAGGPAWRAVVVLRSGSELLGTLETMDAETIQFSVEGSGRMKIPRSLAARIGLHRSAPLLARSLRGDTPGVLLRGGDFFEGDIKELTKERVAVSSVLFGIRRFDLTRAVAVVVLGGVTRTGAEFELTTTGGSQLRIQSVGLGGGMVEVEELSLGKMWLSASRLRDLRRAESAAPRAK